MPAEKPGSHVVKVEPYRCGLARRATLSSGRDGKLTCAIGRGLRAAFLECAVQDTKAVGTHGHYDVTDSDIKMVAGEYKTECNQCQPGGDNIGS